MGKRSGQVLAGDARFTVITPTCVRMEYAPREGFVDAPTLFATERGARCGEVAVTRRDGLLTLDTGRMRIAYRADGKAFHDGNLSVAIRHGDGSVDWTPGMRNAQNLGGPLATLDGIGGAVPLPEGLLARDGWHVVDDTGRHLLVDGWIRQRPGGLPVERGMTFGQDLDWYLFGYGTDYKAALHALGVVSGRAAMPRKHVLGSWYCRWHRYTADDFRQIVREYREHDFPLDILVMDMDWHTLDARSGLGHAYTLGWTGYTWDRTLLPDAEALLEELAADGIRVTLNDHPADGIRSHEECYPEFMRLLGRDPSSGEDPPFDAGDRAYMESFFQAAHAALERQGIDFWWVDWQQDYAFPYVHGVPGLKHLPWLNHLYYRHSQDAGRRGQGFSRWGGWGDHRHPIQFSGDAAANWAMLAFEVPFTLASGNAGCFFWAHDVGGFHGERDPEAYTRWTQFGALSAALRLHSCGEHLDRRPWLWGQPFVDAMRAAFHLRAQLFPYLYSSVRQCHDAMLPLLRPMYLEYPEVPEAYACDTQYLLGDALLVAPIVTPGEGPDKVATRTVWLPPGSWCNFFTGKRLEGGRSITVTADITEIPLFVRAGVPLPLQPYTPRMTSTPLATLVIRCYPGEGGSFRLYEDDGVGQGYLQGECAWTELRSERQGDCTRLWIGAVAGSYAGQPAKRACRVELPGLGPATQATVDGRPAKVDYDDVGKTVRVVIPARDIRRPVEIVVHAEISRR
jgi:alpha-glucosidase (family GH31 glycosyl hydrolase)